MSDLSVNILTAPLGQTHFFTTGQAGFIIKSASGQLLGLDMYLTDCVERIEGHVGYHRLLPKILAPSEIDFDVVIATHPHKDHFDDDAIPVLMANGKTKLYASVDCEQDVKRLFMTGMNIAYVKPGDYDQVGDFELDFINCDHGTGAPDAVGVIITVDDKRIMAVGDSCLRLDRVAEYLKKGSIDVMVAPINGAYGNLNEDECVELAEALQPKLTIPCHYGMFASHGGNLGKFYENMKSKCPNLAYKMMCQGEGIVL